MKLKNKIYYYEGFKVIIIGVKNQEPNTVLISPIGDIKLNWTYEISNFYFTNYTIEDRYKDRKYVYGVDIRYLSIL